MLAQAGCTIIMMGSGQAVDSMKRENKKKATELLVKAHLEQATVLAGRVTGRHTGRGYARVPGQRA